MTQEDTQTYTVPVTDDTRRRMYEHILGDDFLKEIEANTADDGFQIEWDDTNRDKQEAVENGKQGFIAETSFAAILDRAGIEYEWGGHEGEPDFVIEDKTIDVKSRQSKGNYRNLIKDYIMNNSDSVDFYLHTIVHYDPIDRTEITAVEFVGYISNDEVEMIGQPTQLYEDNDYESEKKEVHPKHLKPIWKLLEIASA